MLDMRGPGEVVSILSTLLVARGVMNCLTSLLTTLSSQFRHVASMERALAITLKCVSLLHTIGTQKYKNISKQLVILGRCTILDLG